MVENVDPNSETFQKEERNNNHYFSHNDNIEKKSTKKKNNISNNVRASLDKGKNLGTFILGQKIGEGTFGVVRIATHIITGEKVAVKILDRQKISNESDMSRLEKEIRVLKMLHHNNIVHLYNVIQTSSAIYLVTEYIEGKELFDYIVHKKRLSELEACKFYQQLISGIEYLGKMKITHRDLKPENLLLDKKKNIKLVDFGLSNVYKNNELLSTACGSPSYAAPEMLSGKKYNGLNVDIWSSGIILYAMICGHLPFEDKDNIILYKKIKQGIFKIPEFISDNAKDLLHRILNTDPEKRYNIEQIKAHPWFNIINPNLYMSEGLLLNTYIIPIDEDIIDKMVNEYEYNGIEVMINILANKHNHLTTTYYLLLAKKIRKGEKSICNTNSNEFKTYINNPRNLLSNYNGNWKQLFIDRTKGKFAKIQEKIKEIKINNDTNETKQKIDPIININNNDNNNNNAKVNNVNKNEDNNSNITHNLNENNNKNNNTMDVNDEIKKKDNSNGGVSDDNNKEKIKKVIIDKKNNKEIKKPVSIFEYLKKIKEWQKKKNKEENKNFNISSELRSPNTEKVGKSDSLLHSEKKNKKYKEYENKLKISKRTFHKYSISTVSKNTIDNDYIKGKSNTIFNNIFEKKHLNDNNRKKIILYRNKKTINTSILHKNNYLSNKSINDDKFKNKANHFFTIEHDSPIRKLYNSKYIDNNLKKKYEEGKCYKYKKGKGKKEKEKEKTNNSYRKTNSKNNIKHKYILIRNEINHNNKNSETSLKKRQKYSHSIDSKRKKIKKIKDITSY